MQTRCSSSSEEEEEEEDDDEPVAGAAAYGRRGSSKRLLGLRHGSLGDARRRRTPCYLA